MERQSSAAPTSICDFSQRSLKRLRKPVLSVSPSLLRLHLSLHQCCRTSQRAWHGCLAEDLDRRIEVSSATLQVSSAMFTMSLLFRSLSDMKELGHLLSDSKVQISWGLQRYQWNHDPSRRSPRVTPWEFMHIHTNHGFLAMTILAALYLSLCIYI